ncbi:MAG: hypothetical protein WBE20_11695 [Candidatus Acidiferrales bacterium]
MNSLDDAESRSTRLNLREGYELYGAQVRNRLVIGAMLLSVGLLISTFWHHFPRDSFAHKLSIWISAACFGAAEFVWAWARLLWRSWVKGRPFTTMRLRFEMAMAVLVCVFFSLWVLDWLKW